MKDCSGYILCSASKNDAAVSYNYTDEMIAMNAVVVALNKKKLIIWVFKKTS